MIIIDMSQFRRDATEAEAQAAVRRILFPYLKPAEDEPHEHAYTIALIQEDEAGVELATFEAPCPNGNAAGHVRALVDNLRELADEIRDAHADLLAEAGEPQATHGEMPSHTLVDLLSLARSRTVTEDEVMEWTPEQRKEAANWAGAVHFAASDNEVEVPDQPDFLAQGDFRIGDLVRNRQTGAQLTVTGGGTWLKSFYELVATRESLRGTVNEEN